jgi:equilibrative nucleoside transporter 1/2/3
MDKMRSILPQPVTEQEYAPLRDNGDDEEDDTMLAISPTRDDGPFSWLEYVVFLLLGVAMLWAW